MTISAIVKPLSASFCKNVTAVNIQTWRGCRGRTYDASFDLGKGGGAAGARRGLGELGWGELEWGELGWGELVSCGFSTKSGQTRSPSP